MNMVGDMNRYTQFQVAQSMPIAAANEGGGAGLGFGFGAGMTMAQQIGNAMRPGQQPPEQAPPPAAPPAAPAPAAPQGGTGAPAADLKFCMECGNKMPRQAKFCPECGTKQQ